MPGYGASTRNGGQIGSGNQKFRVQRLIALRGRKKAATSPCRDLAETQGLPILAPPSINTPEARAALAAWRPELSPGSMSLREMERELVLEALRRSNFLQKDAARLLGVSRRKLNYMIRRMGITHASWRRNRPAGAAAAHETPEGASRAP